MKEKESPGKNYEMNEDIWDNLDTWERRDHEQNSEYMSDAPVRLRERELKAENEQVFWNDGLRIIELKIPLNISWWVKKDSHNRK